MKRLVYTFAIIAAVTIVSLQSLYAASISGTLLQVTGKPGSQVLLVMSAGKLNKVKLLPGTQLKRGESNMGYAKIEPSALKPGDLVKVESTSKGAQSVTAEYSIVRGQIKTLLNKSILLTDGKLVDVNPNASVTTESGTSLPFSVLRRGDYVTLKTNPSTQEAWQIVLSEEKSPLVITSIIHDANRALKPGDTITVVLEGTPEAKAVFSISRVASSVKMNETKPGHYVGRLSITKDTKTASAVPVIGRISKDGKTTGPMQAGRLVTVSQSQWQTGKQAPVKPVVDTLKAKQNETVTVVAAKPADKTSIPAVTVTPAVAVVPRTVETIDIQKPLPGSKVRDPFFVVGKARANSKVRIEVTYTNGMSGLLKLAGSLYSADVSTDQAGIFRSDAISTSRMRSGSDIDIAIKVGLSGEYFSKSPVIIRVRND